MTAKISGLKTDWPIHVRKRQGSINATEDSLYTAKGLNDAQMLSTKSKSELHNNTIALKYLTNC